MNKSRVNDSLYWLMLRTMIGAKHGAIKLAEKHGLTLMEVFVLFLLKENQSSQMKDLSRKLSCDASYITTVVDKLYTHGYVARDECTTDRRIKLITLTQKGMDFCDRITIELPHYQPAGLALFTDEEKDQLRALLIKILGPEDFTKVVDATAAI